MQTDNEQIDRLIADLRSASSGSGVPPTPPPFTRPGGSGSGGDMEARIAKLEANMEHVKGELSKLSGVPADLATLKERTSHLPTKADMKDEVKTAIDRAASRVQRNIGIIGGIVAIAVAAINYLPRFF